MWTVSCLLSAPQFHLLVQRQIKFLLTFSNDLLINHLSSVSTQLSQCRLRAPLTPKTRTKVRTSGRIIQQDIFIVSRNITYFILKVFFISELMTSRDYAIQRFNVLRHKRAQLNFYKITRIFCFKKTCVCAHQTIFVPFTVLKPLTLTVSLCRVLI